MRWRLSPLCLLLAACAGGEARPAELRYAGYQREGQASWYGAELAGARTATGERYDPDAVTVAHRTLPLGSLVEVTSLGTGRAIVARVADRGPGRADRLVDLSRGAARLLGTDRQAVASVRLRALAPGSGQRAGLVLREGAPVAADRPLLDPARRYLVQVASFSSESRARDLAVATGAGVTRADGRWRVRLGPLSAAGAQRARDAAAARGYGDALILPLD